MRESFVLRLVAEARTSGQIVGELEDVATGKRTPLRGLADLLTALLGASEGTGRPEQDD